MMINDFFTNWTIFKWKFKIENKFEVYNFLRLWQTLEMKICPFKMKFIWHISRSKTKLSCERIPKCRENLSTIPIEFLYSTQFIEVHIFTYSSGVACMPKSLSLLNAPQKDAWELWWWWYFFQWNLFVWRLRIIVTQDYLSRRRLLSITRPFFDYEFYDYDFYVTIGNHFCDRVRRKWRGQKSIDFSVNEHGDLRISLNVSRQFYSLTSIAADFEKHKNEIGLWWCHGKRNKILWRTQFSLSMAKKIQHAFAHWRKAKRVEENPFFRHSILRLLHPPLSFLCQKKSNWEMCEYYFIRLCKHHFISFHFIFLLKAAALLFYFWSLFGCLFSLSFSDQAIIPTFEFFSLPIQ